MTNKTRMAPQTMGGGKSPQRILAAAVIGLLIACGPGRPPEPPRQLQLKTQLAPFEVGNGILGILAPDLDSSTVTVVARYWVGSSQDPQGKAGLAHLVEHMLFAKRVGETSLGEALGDVTLFNNADTTYDTTTYISLAPSENIEQVLSLEAIRLSQGCATLTEEIFLHEREIVRNEIRSSQSERGGDFFALISEAVYPDDHAYRRPIGGDDTQLVNITLQDVCTFIDKYYGPENLALSITGGVTELRLGSALNSSFGRVKRRTTSRPPRPTPPPNSALGGKKVVETDIDLPYAIVVFRMPPQGTKQRIAADMVLRLAQGRASSFADTYEFATSVDSISLGGPTAQMVGVAIRLRSESDADEAFDAVWKSFGKADDALSEEVFTRMVAVKQTSVMLSIDEPMLLARSLAEDREAYSKRFFFEDLDKIKAITRSFAKAQAKTLFTKSNSVAILVKPKANAERRYRRAAPSFSTGNVHGASRSSKQYSVADAGRPATLPMVKARATETRQFALSNGMRVVLAPTSSTPLIQLRLVFGAGNAAEPNGKSGVADIAANFLELDPSITSDVEIRAAIQVYRTGGLLSSAVTDDYTEFSATGLEMYLDHLIEGLERRIKAGTYDNSTIERFKKAKKAELSTRGSKEAAAASQAIYSHTFGDDHPYATRGFWNLDQLKSVGSDAANDFRSRHYVGANASIIVTGKFDIDLVEKHIRFHFGSWSEGSKTPPVLAPPVKLGGATAKAIALAGTNNDVVDIRVTFPVDKVIGEDTAKLLVLENMLSTQVSAIRSELGASYGFSASLTTTRGPGMLSISGRADAPRAGEALKVLLAGIENVRTTNDAFAINFAASRQQVVNSYLAQSQSTFGVGARLRHSMLNELPLDYDQQTAKRVSQLTPADVHQAAKRYLAVGEARVMLTGTDANVNAAFAAAGFTSITR